MLDYLSSSKLLVLVYLDGEYRVAQYGQFRRNVHHAELMSILSFLKDMDLATFKQRVRASRWTTHKDYEKTIRDLGHNPNNYNVPPHIAAEYHRLHPQFKRECSPASVLHQIYNASDGVLLFNALDLATNSSMLDVCYVIDLDSKNFEIYTGLNVQALDKKERFACFPMSKVNGNYHQVKHLTTCPISGLLEVEEFADLINHKMGAVA